MSQVLPLTDKDKMPYGEHKGKAMANVPDKYLLWLYNNNKCSPPVYGYILANIESIKANANKFLSK